jgi:CheY-like chemotaxis protein
MELFGVRLNFMHDQENRTDISVGEIGAGLKLQASAGWFSIGLVNWFKIIREGFAHQFFFGAARAWVKSFLILLMAGLWCVPLHGATNVFETPPPKVGSVQWDDIQRLTKKRQELYRKRVSVPGAMAEDIPRAEGANFANRTKTVAVSTPPYVASGEPFKILFFAAVFAFTGILILKKFAPHVLIDFNQQFNPWALAPTTKRIIPAHIRAEEEAFAKFLATFRVGPVASPRADLLEIKNTVKEFYSKAAKLLRAQRALLRDIGQKLNGPARQKLLAELCSEMGSLKGAAGLPETLTVWQVASALEGLLKQLAEKSGNVTASTLRAVNGGLDLLDELCVPGLKPDLLTERPLKFLVVDDDLISRQAMSLALKKTFGQPDLAVDGETALTQAGRQTYDVIFLDVQLPGMDGFELCTKIRDATLNRNTPVIFVTGQSDFDARAKSTLSGGNDLMGKPFLTFEITVKALTLALQGRLKKFLPKLEQSKDKADSSVTFTKVVRSVPSSTITACQPLLTTAMAETNNFTDAFLIHALKNLGPLRELCQTILQTSDEETRQNMLADGFLRINSLIFRNGSEVVHPAYQICAALEGLFKKLLENPKYSTPSALATVAVAVDLLPELCAPGLRADLAVNPPIHMLVVDDDLVARRVIVGALQTAFARPESAENGEAVLALTTEKTFDVIFLDVVMPGMDGFEVCSKIRETISNRATPIVFVTGQSDFETRTRMSRTGGNDLMGKPFLTPEITVKALTFALRGRLDQLKVQPTL